MPDGFKVASAYVVVSPDTTGFAEKLDEQLAGEGREISIPAVLDPTRVDESVLKVRAEVESGAPAKIPAVLQSNYADADAKIRQLERELGADPVKVPTEAQDPINAAFITKLQASIKGIAADALKIPADPDMDAFRAKVQAGLAEFNATTKEKLDVVPDLSQFRTRVLAEVEALQTEVKASIKVQADDASLAALKAKVDAAAQNAGQGGGGLMAAAIGAGVMLGGPAIGAAMAGVGALGLTALGTRLQAGDPSIEAAWGNLANDARVSATSFASAMVDPISTAIDQIDADFQRQEPLIQHMFASAAGDIPIFSSGLLSLVDNSLPGFDNALTHSQVIMQGLAHLMGSTGAGISDIGNQVASSSGRIGADLSSLGTIVHTVETGVGSLVSITSGLAEGALPALNGALGTITSTLGAVSSLLGPIEPELGGIAATAGGAYLAFSKLQPMADKLTLSLAEKGGLLGGLSGLAGGIPFVGAAVTALSTVTGILAEQNEKAAQAATDEARSSDNLNHSLGALTNTTQAQIDKSVMANAAGQSWLNTGASLSEILKDAGVSQSEFTSGLEGNASALNATRDALDNYQIHLNDLMDHQQNVTHEQGVAAQGANLLAGHLNDLAGAFANSSVAAQLQAVRMAEANLGISKATINSAQLAQDMQVLGDATSTTTARTTALTDALALMASGGAEPANDALAQAWSTVNGLGSALQGTSGRLLDTTGQLDLTTTKGEAANTAIENLRNQTAAYAQALTSQGLSSADVRTKTQALVDQMIGPLAKALGLSQTQVQSLIQQYDLVPATITTTIGLNTDAAYSSLNTLLGRIASANPTISVGIAQGAAQKGVQLPQAAGGILKFWADGGIGGRSLSPMPPIAQVVPPNTWRVVGDRSDVDEAYIPLDRSGRSRRILAEANRAMGQDGGQTVNNYQTNHWTVVSQDPYEAARLVAAQQQWNRMIGATI